MPEPEKPPEVPAAGGRPRSLVESAADVEEARKALAHLQCRLLSRAIEEYANSPKNPGTTAEEKLPGSIVDLMNPPFAGEPFLKDELKTFIDPWDRAYAFNLRRRKDGTAYVLVHTTAPDKTPISQFGVGPNSVPK